MMKPQRMRKHSVEKTRVSSKLVSVSPPPSPAFRIISTRSANYRSSNISSQPTNSHHLSKTSAQSSVDVIASDFSERISPNQFQNMLGYNQRDILWFRFLVGVFFGGFLVGRLPSGVEGSGPHSVGGATPFHRKTWILKLSIVIKKSIEFDNNDYR